MAKAPRVTVLWIAVLFVCGCGTIANLETGARQEWKNATIYGGARRDIHSARQWIDHSWTWGKNLNVIQDIGTVVGVVLVGIDVPLSAVGDTVTLPVTVSIALWSNAVNRENVQRSNTAAPSAAMAPANEQRTTASPVANAAGSR